MTENAPRETPRELVEPAGDATEFVFFSGKGGVGKSTVSCATAQWLAEEGYDTLLVTTDPAPNLGDIFDQSIGHSVTGIHGVENLEAIEIDPDRAAEEYRQRTLEPLRELLDEKQLQTVEEQLDSPCVEEIAAFDKFVEFMDDPDHDVIVFDTAPTGHTIRLMELPSGWNEELEDGGATCVGPADSLVDQKETYENAIETLEGDRSSFVFVGKPEESAINEIERSAGELAALGIDTDLVVVNGYLPEEVCEDPFFESKRADEQAVLEYVEREFADEPVVTYPLRPGEITGSELLSDVAAALYEGFEPTIDVESTPSGGDAVGTLDATTDTDAVMEQLRPHEDTRYLFFTGKGGVGKSTTAATAATSLAQRGYETLIVTTDPAAHLKDVFGTEVEHEPTAVGLDGLHAARIDQEKALEEYKARTLEQVEQSFEGGDLEAAQQQVLEELESPCAEEMAALEKFVDYFEVEGYDVVVFDTAPTGHTLRLLELPSDWKGFMDLGSLTKEASESGQRYDRVIETMRDPERSSFVFVMYPEYTPMMEAYRAAEDLRDQVGIETSLVAVNYLLPEEYGDNAFFESRRRQQREYLDRIDDRFEVPMLLVPLRKDEPTGLDDLQSFGAEILGEPTAEKPQPELQ
ncbi:arsenite-transporting ATPase [Halalkaliarchaeum desulfuricum]|uniref:Arsenite-transporting ATPase n=1 Tax=Halalkaliarchaeum desulfuricum TaxID=2055893 RepID=A0A343TG57_9EURY|nr:arsenical pump-driving ATPase [Halalkaliarchaeum desulfuricum]AUX08079.1 arsenite-transporting ATPase [Halalkaliarchaeum desulfuricum]